MKELGDFFVDGFLTFWSKVSLLLLDCLEGWIHTELVCDDFEVNPLHILLLPNKHLDIFFSEIE